MGLTPEEFSRRFKGSAVKRTKRRGLLRIASREGCPPEVASQIGESLTSRLFVEEDEWVGEELSLALSSDGRPWGALRSATMALLWSARFGMTHVVASGRPVGVTPRRCLSIPNACPPMAPAVQPDALRNGRKSIRIPGEFALSRLNGRGLRVDNLRLVP
ncbi:MAG TPA: hypothetical protein VHG28_09680 [Longimicrobiaceae bacterium]|nr:hypothetical protein [Longimicrobiaceae bacterium]